MRNDLRELLFMLSVKEYRTVECSNFPIGDYVSYNI